MEQRSDEWFSARLGKVTASRVSDVIAKTKTGASASRANYMAELLCERLTGEKAQSFSSAAMQWGEEQEGAARAAYSLMTDATVDLVGFVVHPEIPFLGASPDGLVGEDGLVEIKCPNTATHIDTLLRGEIEKKYVTQMMVQMACTGRKWCDFVSFDPRLPPEMQLWIKRVERDQAKISEITSEVISFLGELDAKEAELRARYMEREQWQAR